MNCIAAFEFQVIFQIFIRCTLLLKLVQGGWVSVTATKVNLIILVLYGFVTNYHKLGDLNNISVLSCSSIELKSDTSLSELKSGLVGICSFLEALGRDLFPCLFQFLGVTSFLVLVAIFLHLQGSNAASF